MVETIIREEKQSRRLGAEDIYDMRANDNLTASYESFQSKAYGATEGNIPIGVCGSGKSIREGSAKGLNSGLEPCVAAAIYTNSRDGSAIKDDGELWQTYSCSSILGVGDTL